MGEPEKPAAVELEEEKTELVTFQVKCVYVYLPLPPVTSIGWRAELWNVEKWYKEVKLKVVFVSADDALYVRLHDQETDELFAECPLPSDGSPLTRAVEPVIDSSRYYVLRVVDREDAKRHAFMGLGFRERSESSSFSAALDDYRQYLRRKAEAAQLQEEHSRSSSQGSAGGGEDGADGEDGRRGSGGERNSGKFKLADGQRLSLRLPGSAVRASSIHDSDRASPLARRQVMRVFSLNETIAGLRIMPPPPPPGSRTSSGQTADWAVFTDSASSSPRSSRTLSMRASGELARTSAEHPISPRAGCMAVTPAARKPMATSSSGGSGKQGADEEEWGDFKSTA